MAYCVACVMLDVTCVILDLTCLILDVTCHVGFDMHVSYWM